MDHPPVEAFCNWPDGAMAQFRQWGMAPSPFYPSVLTLAERREGMMSRFLQADEGSLYEIPSIFPLIREFGLAETRSPQPLSTATT